MGRVGWAGEGEKNKKWEEEVWEEGLRVRRREMRTQKAMGEGIERERRGRKGI